MGDILWPINLRIQGQIRVYLIFVNFFRETHDHLIRDNRFNYLVRTTAATQFILLIAFLFAALVLKLFF